MVGISPDIFSPTETITNSGYLAWLTLKAALEVPHIKDLSQVDRIQLDTFRTCFTKEGLAFKEECRKMINELSQEIIIWAQSVAEFHINFKLENIWTLESFPSICVDLFKEFGVNRSTHVEVEDTYKYLLSFAGKSRTIKPFSSHWPHKVNINKIFFDSDGKSDGCQKRKREIKESKALLVTTLRDNHEEDPYLFGNNNNKPANKELKTN